jgi:hypothetical protein
MREYTYYFSYLGLTVALIVWLARTLHRSGSVFLQEAFRDNPAVIHAVSHLLDVGFYLTTIGYVTITFRGYWPLDTWLDVVQVESVRLGFFLLFLGFVHLFNLLLLAIFRRRTVLSTPTGAH